MIGKERDHSDDIRPFRHAHLNWFWGSYSYIPIIEAVLEARAGYRKADKP